MSRKAQGFPWPRSEVFYIPVSALAENIGLPPEARSKVKAEALTWVVLILRGLRYGNQWTHSLRGNSYQ